ncbi:MAG: hypothetical protein ACREVB_04085 [Burkholderiales bacterium]
MAAEFIPLARAAALLHERLAQDHGVKDAKTLDLIALALSAHIPLYQGDVENGALRALAATEIAGGRFTRGAARLEFPDRAPLRFLLVSRRELYAAIEAILRDPTCPLLKLCRPQCHPRPPACS